MAEKLQNPVTGDTIEQESNSAVQRNSWEAVNPNFGKNPQAEALKQAQDQALIQQAEKEQQAADKMEAMGVLAAMADPMAYLKEFASDNKKVLSLDTLSDEEKEKIKRVYINCRNIADHHYKNTIEPIILERRKIYEATEDHYKKKFPGLSEYSNWVSKDIKTACQWILSSITEAFIGGDDPVSVKGVNIEDDVKAKHIQELIKYELVNKNNYVDWVINTLETALRDNFAITKVYWKRTEERTPYDDLIGMNETSKHVAIMNGVAAGKLELQNVQPLSEAPDFSYVSYDEIKLKDNYPVVEFIPSSEFRYTPDQAKLQECKFVAHRKVVRGDYLKRKEAEGIYKDVDEALEKFSRGNTSATQLDIANDYERTERTKNPDDNDNASKLVELYEAYLQVDYNNDGIFEKIIVHAVGDTIIRVADNDFGIPPMFVCQAVSDANSVFCKDSFTDNLEQLQDLKTALIRQLIINTAKNNSPRLFVDERLVDMDALISGDEIIGCQGNPDGMIWAQPNLMISNNAMDLINYTQGEIESQSGSTKYNQGLDAGSLNKTATGIASILGASEKRNKLLGRSIAERFFIPLYKFLILLNQKYLEDGQMIRLTNESVNISRDELDIDYDLIVNVGTGAGSKEEEIRYLMYTLQSLYPQLTAQGIVNSTSWYNLVSRLLNAMGLRDVSQYLLDPNSEEAKQAAEQARMAAIQEKAEALQNSLQLSIAKSSVPRVTMDVKNMPPDAQQQYYQNKMGIITTEQAIAQHEEDLANANKKL